MTAPSSALADPDAVEEWLRALARLRAVRFVAPPPADGALQLDDVRYQLSGARIARRDGEPDALLYPEDAAALLDPDPLRFRDRRVLRFRVDDAVALTVERGGERQRFPRTADGFASVAAGRAVEALSDLRAARFDRAPFRAAQRLIVTLRSDGGDGERTVELDGQCRAHVDEVTFALSEEACAALTLSRDAAPAARRPAGP
jgi:hypothetical protein